MLKAWADAVDAAKFHKCLRPKRTRADYESYDETAVIPVGPKSTKHDHPCIAGRSVYRACSSFATKYAARRFAAKATSAKAKGKAKQEPKKKAKATSAKPKGTSKAYLVQTAAGLPPAPTPPRPIRTHAKPLAAHTEAMPRAPMPKHTVPMPPPPPPPPNMPQPPPPPVKRVPRPPPAALSKWPAEFTKDDEAPSSSVISGIGTAGERVFIYWTRCL